MATTRRQPRALVPATEQSGGPRWSAVSCATTGVCGVCARVTSLTTCSRKGAGGTRCRSRQVLCGARGGTAASVLRLLGSCSLAMHRRHTLLSPKHHHLPPPTTAHLPHPATSHHLPTATLRCFGRAACPCRRSSWIVRAALTAWPRTTARITAAPASRLVSARKSCLGSTVLRAPGNSAARSGARSGTRPTWTSTTPMETGRLSTSSRQPGARLSTGRRRRPAGTQN